MAAQVEKVYRFENAEQEIGLVGAQDSNLKLIEEGMHVALSVFGDQLTIKGEADAVDAAEAITTDTNARYKAFAKAEAYLLSLGVQIPVNSLGGTPSVTKVIPFTRPATWSGTPSPRFEGMKISKKTITTKAYDKAVKDWNAKRLELAKKND